MPKAGWMGLDFAAWFEPEAGINTPQEFTRELETWAEKAGHRLTMLNASMEPLIELNGKRFRCRLGDPKLAEQNNRLWKKFFPCGITHSVGPFLGYKWVYLYRE